MQFSINWDPNVLDFLSTDNYNLTDLNVNSFGAQPSDVDNGRLRLAWFDMSTSGLTVPDNTVIFTIRCRAIGTPGSSTTVEITDVPTVIEITENGQVIEPVIQNGEINVMSDPNSTLEVENGKIVLHQNYPNPFTGQTDIIFDLKQSEEVTLTINDTSGKVLYTQKAVFPDGTNTMQIKDNIFPSSGVYLYTIKIRNHILTNKMIVL